MSLLRGKYFVNELIFFSTIQVLMVIFPLQPATHLKST